MFHCCQMWACVCTIVCAWYFLTLRAIFIQRFWGSLTFSKCWLNIKSVAMFAFTKAITILLELKKYFETHKCYFVTLIFGAISAIIAIQKCMNHLCTKTITEDCPWCSIGVIVSFWKDLAIRVLENGHVSSDDGRHPSYLERSR